MPVRFFLTPRDAQKGVPVRKLVMKTEACKENALQIV